MSNNLISGMIASKTFGSQRWESALKIEICDPKNKVFLGRCDTIVTTIQFFFFFG